LNLNLFSRFFKRAKPTAATTLRLNDPSAYYGRYRGDKDIKPVRDLMERQTIREEAELFLKSLRTAERV
jgi:hypothetical protein